MADGKPHVSATSANQAVKDLLRRQDTSSLAGSLGSLLWGVAVCFGGAFVAASFIYILLWLWFSTSYIGWVGWFWVYILVMVPLIIWSERKYRRDYLTAPVALTDPAPSSIGEYQTDQFKQTANIVTGMVVWGPRKLVDGVHGVMQQRTPLQNAAFDRAAILVLDLYRADGGVEIRDLLHAPEDMQVFGLAVDKLEAFGWIGKASNGRSLWLSSTFRARLRDELRTASR